MNKVESASRSATRQTEAASPSNSAVPMVSLLGLCDELLHEIFTQVQERDLAALSSTCRTFNAYIKGNPILWRDTFTLNHDEPTEDGDFDWEGELQSIARMQTILESRDVELKRRHIAQVTETAIKYIERADKRPELSKNIRRLQTLFDEAANRDVFLYSSSLFGVDINGVKKAGTEDQMAASTREERQLSAKLHAYYGSSRETLGRTRSRAAHPYARSKVYDLRNYNDKNYWGPYQDDGTMSVDWERVEAIMIVLAYNLRKWADRLDDPRDGDVDACYDRPFEGVTPNSYLSRKEVVCPGVKALVKSGLWRPLAREVKILQVQPDPPLDAQDPFGVRGTWRRVVCFLDYNDLYAFNFINIPTDLRMEHEDREPITTQEAIRLITMKLEVSKMEEAGPNDDNRYPVVYFKGMSRSMHATWDPNANSRLLGTVRMTANGDVRWTTLSIFHGEARWRSESIQLGGIGSARGVIGTWFDKDYGANGPAGPTAFWKICDEEDEANYGSEDE